jgi:hypothetical protein
MTCEIFEYLDPESSEDIPLLGIHYYFPEELIYRSNNVNDEDLKGFLYVNRTDLSE